MIGRLDSSSPESMHRPGQDEARHTTPADVRFNLRYQRHRMHFGLL